MKLLIITWVHVCISFNKLIWLIQKNEKIDILSLLFMPSTGNKSSGAKKGSDEWWWDNFTNIFWVKRTFNNWSAKNRDQLIWKIWKCSKEFDMAPRCLTIWRAKLWRLTNSDWEVLPRNNQALYFFDQSKSYVTI